MLPDDRKGMLIQEVINNVDQLSCYISEENKIDFDLKELGDKALNTYNSINSAKLNKNNERISNSEYCKIRNLNSYKKYLENRIEHYKKIGKANEKVFDEVIQNFKQQK